MFFVQKKQKIFFLSYYILKGIFQYIRKGGLYMVKKEDDIAYEIEIERSEEMEQEIDNSINQMNDEFRMTRTAAELTDLQGKEE